jgi:hypothetical protein
MLLGCGLALGSCGRAANDDELQIDSNTNWLKRCDADDQCSGSLRCYCGQCSQPCAQTDECGLLAGAECASSGGAVCGDQPGAGGLCVLGCTEDTECGIDFSCAAGQCVPKPCAGEYLSPDDVYGLIARDLAQLDPEDTLAARYVTLANHSPYHACESTFAAERQGLSKLINSLTLSTTLAAPVTVDPAELLYRIDLRDYDWNQPIRVRGVVYPDVWEALVDNDEYATASIGDDADDAATSTGARVPLLFVSSLMATATRPEIYAALLGIPERLQDFYTALGVDAANADARSGFSEGREVVASHFQMQSRTGFVWQLAALRARDGSLFADPLLEPSGDREVVFTLPNGLFGFAYFDGNGIWLDSSDDFLDAVEIDFRARAPRFPLRRHWPGASLGADEVRPFVDQNPNGFDSATSSAIARAYPGQEAIGALLRREYEELTLTALSAARVDPSLPEPISSVLQDFSRDVDLEAAAGDLMVTTEHLMENLVLLPPEFQVLDGGTMERSDFTELYPVAYCLLNVVLDNRPDPSACP